MGAERLFTRRGPRPDPGRPMWSRRRRRRGRASSATCRRRRAFGREIAPSRLSAQGAGQDQLESCASSTRPIRSRSLTAEIYDGDTPPSMRRQIRAEPRTSDHEPRGLHLGLIPTRGVGGVLRILPSCSTSHVSAASSGTLRPRMRRLGASPRATGRNRAIWRGQRRSAIGVHPRALGRLRRDHGVDLRARAPLPLIDPAGSPTAARRASDRGGARRNGRSRSQEGASHRELIHSWVAQGGPELADRIASPRWLSSEERREIERRLFLGI
jgi:DEAD/DEAH box helicase domain-containing protein